MAFQLQILYPYFTGSDRVCNWSGNTMENFDCCTSLEPCENGEGDCDNDEECVGNLKCSDGTGMDH